MSDYQPYVPLRIIIAAAEALKAVEDAPYGSAITSDLWSKVMNARARLSVYVDLATQGNVEVRMPDPEVTEVA